MAGQTRDIPVAFTNAIKSLKVIPGDNLKLLDTERLGTFNIVICGDSNDKVIISPADDRAIIQGDVNINGANLRFEGIEFAYLGFTTRDSAYSDSHDMPINYQPDIFGDNIELYRCLIHDTPELGFWKTSKNSKLDECLFWYNGWREPGSAYGHAIYTQNNDGYKIIKNCILFLNYGDGLKLGGTDNAGVCRNYLFENCIFFDNLVPSNITPINGSIGGGILPYENIILRGCEFYIRSSEFQPWGFSIGYTNGLDNFEITNCFFDAWLPIYIYPQVPYTNFTINNNLFYSSHTERGYHTTYPAADLLADPTNVWQEKPTSGKRIRLIICEAGVRGHLLIYNYDLDNTVDADCSALLSEGDDYRLTNVQDLFVDIITGTAGVGGVVTVPMTGRSISSPVGDTAPLSTFPEFGCFIIEKI